MTREEIKHACRRILNIGSIMFNSLRYMGLYECSYDIIGECEWITEQVLWGETRESDITFKNMSTIDEAMQDLMEVVDKLYCGLSDMCEYDEDCEYTRKAISMASGRLSTIKEFTGILNRNHMKETNDIVVQRIANKFMAEIPYDESELGNFFYPVEDEDQIIVAYNDHGQGIVKQYENYKELVKDYGQY